MKYLIIILIQLIGLSLHGQNLVMDWRQCYGGVGYDEGNDLVRTNSGYLILSVWNQQQVWLIKTDFDGNFMWEKKYGGSYCDYTNKILKKDENTFYIIGSTSSSDGDITYDPYPDSDDFWIVKIDSLGNKIWDKIFGGTGIDDAYNAV